MIYAIAMKIKQLYSHTRIICLNVFLAQHCAEIMESKFILCSGILKTKSGSVSLCTHNVQVQV